MTTCFRDSRVVISGAAGFLGARLTRRLSEGGAFVHAFVRRTSDLWRISDLLDDLTLHHIDLTNRDVVIDACRRICPDYIIHTAAEGVAPDMRERWRIVGNNIAATTHLLEASDDLDYKRFLHVGGSSEYGSSNSRLLESNMLDPTTLYGASKAAASIICRQYARASGRPVVVLRPFSIYGYGEPEKRLVPTCIRALLDQGEIKLTSHGFRRDWIFVEDVVDACLLCLGNDRINGEVINVGTGEQTTNEAIVETLQQVAGRPIKVKVGEFPPRLSDTTHWVADRGKAAELLAWQPHHSLRDGLEKTYQWYCDRAAAVD